jgi:nitrogen fixation/metabolism regulation signal transduction histidine kinase
MKWLDHRKILFNQEGGLQDTVFLVGILLLVSILIIGLFPVTGSEALVTQEFFIYSVMVIPVIAAIYFIITSFRRNIYEETGSIGSSIRKKMVLAFVFVAVLPTLPVVLAANYLLKQTMSYISYEKTSKAREDARRMSEEPVRRLHDVVKNDSETLAFLYQQNLMTPLTEPGRKAVYEYARHRNYGVEFYSRNPRGGIVHVPLKEGSSPLAEKIGSFFDQVGDYGLRPVYRVSLGGRSLFAASIIKKDVITVLYRQISPEIALRMQLFDESLQDYRNLEFLGEYFKSNTSVCFFSVLPSSSSPFPCW